MDKNEMILILLILLFACIALYLAITLKELNNKNKKYSVNKKTNNKKIKSVMNEDVDNKHVDKKQINVQENYDEYYFPELEQYQAYAFSRSGAYRAKQRNHQNLLNQQYLDDEIKNDY